LQFVLVTGHCVKAGHEVVLFLSLASTEKNKENCRKEKKECKVDAITE
jgi:hypothetical protein